MALIPEDYDLNSEALGRFLRAIREEQMISVRELAKAAQLDYSHLSKIELGRSDVSLSKFVRLCYALQMSPGLVLESCSTIGYLIYDAAFYNDPEVMALASADGEMNRDKRKYIRDFLSGTTLLLAYILKSGNPIVLIEAIQFPVPSQKENFKRFILQRMPEFSLAERRSLLEAIISGGWKILRRTGLAEDGHIDDYLRVASQMKSRWIPSPLAIAHADSMTDVTALEAQMSLLVRTATREEQQKEKLTLESEFRNTTADMKLARTMKELLDEVRELTKPSGMKAALADYLRVPRSRVSEWLAGKYKPSGKVTLKLIRWVNDPRERQQK